jgi:crotonobetainyl-CoA:carnitine CoA-transferase CaiB-like acyl-CoA transferase
MPAGRTTSNVLVAFGIGSISRRRAATRGARASAITASHCLAGVLAALFARERTGKGQLVDACLLRSGIYTIGST